MFFVEHMQFCNISKFVLVSGLGPPLGPPPGGQNYAGCCINFEIYMFSYLKKMVKNVTVSLIREGAAKSMSGPTFVVGPAPP